MKVDRNARTWCEISLPALRNNLRTLRRCLPPKNKILAVVKDDAYGHGLIPVGRALAQAGCEEFGVACVSEGVQLRKAGIRQPILLLGSTRLVSVSDTTQSTSFQSPMDMWNGGTEGGTVR